MIDVSTRQAQEFAYSVFMDIAEYILNHQKEYQQFLELLGQRAGDDNEK